jgi:hypothetical protein
MDEVFDLMIAKDLSYQQKMDFAKTSSMWFKNGATTLSETFPKTVDFMFTRDYNMVEPPYKQVHQIGVQGGFLIVKPSQRDFDRMVQIILSGGDGYDLREGWGGIKLGYGGYYGAGKTFHRILS